ncbi:MAG: cupin domain-containing protein [Candidatus Cloacimonetes bacterium]|nr:cupin domain-containing protein [Candidatus Cloacimonadota bacterium]
MITRNVETLDSLMNDKGITAHRLYDMEEGQIIHLQLDAWCHLTPHTTPVNVVFYILEGEPTIEIGDERKPCPAGTLVESPKDIIHCIYNYTESPVRVLIMKLPRP